MDEHPEVASSLPRTDVHDVLRLWRNALETFRSGNVNALSGKVDWVCKHRLFEALRARSGGDLPQCKLKQLDLTIMTWPMARCMRRCFAVVRFID